MYFCVYSYKRKTTVKFFFLLACYTFAIRKTQNYIRKEYGFKTWKMYFKSGTADFLASWNTKLALKQHMYIREQQALCIPQ